MSDSPQLHLSALYNALLDRALRDEPEHADLACVTPRTQDVHRYLLLLPNAVCTVLRLEIHLWIPIAVMCITHAPRLFHQRHTCQTG
jgi:hypothetical protein